MQAFRRNIVVLLALAMLGLLCGALAQAQSVDVLGTPWIKIATDHWERHMNPGMPGPVFHYIKEADKGPTFSVTVPCGQSDNRTQTYTWKQGEQEAKAKSPCQADGRSLPTEKWMRFFYPLPDGTSPPPQDDRRRLVAQG